MRMIIDLDATHDPIQGEQEGRHFHGYYHCYCHLPLYIFCGRHLLAAKLRTCDKDVTDGAKEEIAHIVAQIRTGGQRSTSSFAPTLPSPATI